MNRNTSQPGNRNKRICTKCNQIWLLSLCVLVGWHGAEYLDDVIACSSALGRR